MGVVLTIDVGTTNIKAGIVSDTGELLALGKSPVTTHSSEPGAAAHDPEELKEIIIRLCRQVLGAANAQNVSVVSISTYHFGLMLLDAHRRPLTPMTILTDTRSQQTFTDFLRDFDDLKLYENTGCPLLTQYPLPRLYYFSKKKPELFNKVKFVADSKSFLIEWLTGHPVTDVSIATATQFYNVNEFCWDKEIIQRFSLTPDQFPSVADGHATLFPLREALAEMLGLPKNAQVLLGVYDGGAMAVGLSGLQPHTGCMNVGTTAMIRVPCEKPAFDTQENKWIQPYALYKGLFLNGGALNNAALALDWLKQSVGAIDVQDPLLATVNEDQPLFSLPYLTGERDSLLGPFASGVLFGLRRDHTLRDITRAVMEGVAFTARCVYDALKKNNLAIKELRMGGGGVKCEPWPRIFANVLGIPIIISEVSEIALIGNAMLAFTATGKYKNIQTAFHSMVHDEKRIEPDIHLMPVYAKHYTFFKRLRTQTGKLFKEHAMLPVKESKRSHLNNKIK